MHERPAPDPRSTGAVPPAPRPAVVFPVLPALCCAAVFLCVFLILLVPSRIRAHRIEAAAAARGERATWLGYSFYGQAQLIARLAYPADLPPSPPEMHLPPHGIGVLLRVDNSRGTRPVTIDFTASRFTLFNGTSLPVQKPTRGTAEAERTLPPGSDPQQVLLVFDRRAVCERIERLYALQLSIDGVPHHIAGVYYTRVSEAKRDQGRLQKRVQLFPERTSSAP